MRDTRGLTRSGLDDPALAGAVAALEDDHDFQSFVYDPKLQLDRLAVQLASSRSYSLAPSFAKPSDAFLFSAFLALF